MKIRSREEFQDFIHAEKAWRVKELSNAKSLIKLSRRHHQELLLRSSLVILYAHWEGFIKKGCEAFFTYLNYQSPKLRDIRSGLRSVVLYEEFSGSLPKNKVSSFYRLLSHVDDNLLDSKFRVNAQDRVDTESNLTSKVLCELLDIVGLKKTGFELKAHYIDSQLLNYRNAIAHGERTDTNPDFIINEAFFMELSSKIMGLMDLFESLIINNVEFKEYLISSTVTR